MDFSLRPLTRGDILAWADLLAAVEAVDQTGEHYIAADLAEAMANPGVEVGKDFVGAFEPDGQMVGYYSILPRGTAEGHYMVETQGSVRPDRRAQGVGTVLVAGMVERSGQARDDHCPGRPVRLLTAGLSSDDAQAELLASVGLRAERWTFTMRTRLAALPPARPLPPGYRLRDYDESMSEALRVAHNTAFLDHPNFTPWSPDMWRATFTEARSFRPELCFLVSAEGSDEIAAYLETAEFDGDVAATGQRDAYVGLLGTQREHRGQGLASALLGHALHAYQQAGYDAAGLAVDSENPTGALGVYQRAGFAVDRQWTNYVMTLEPPAPASGVAPAARGEP